MIENIIKYGAVISLGLLSLTLLVALVYAITQAIRGKTDEGVPASYLIFFSRSLQILVPIALILLFSIIVFPKKQSSELNHKQQEVQPKNKK